MTIPFDSYDIQNYVPQYSHIIPGIMLAALVDSASFVGINYLTR
jgi:hypothetical protein